MADLSRKRERERLKVRPNDPYTMKLGEGAYLTFRRGPDTWGARYRGKDGKQHPLALSSIATDDYEGAKAAAEAWFAQMGSSAVRSVKRATVKDALDAYVLDLERHGRTKSSITDIKGKLKLTVFSDRLAILPLESATRDDFEEWRDRLRPGRKPRSVNRMVRAVAAGLNRAHELGYVGNPAAWSLTHLTDEVEDQGDTALFLTPAQRDALIGACDGHTAAFLRGLEMTGARPNELAAATARDFDGKTVRFSTRKGKGSKLRPRYTVLGPDGVTFFAEQAADKLPAAPLFTEDGSTPWRRHMWARRIRAAVKAHNKKARGPARLPLSIGAYAFRHARISELLQVYGVDPLTVAQQTGTSIAMIEQAYLKFIPAALYDKLANLKARA